MRACLHCGQPVSAGRGFYELTKQPGGAAAGQLYTLCSDPCLAAFVQGGEPEPETEPDPAMTAAQVALEQWRFAKGGSAAERRAARMMAFRLAALLRAAGMEPAGIPQ